jgi:uncharacterized protein (TIGR00645 family)
MAKSEKQPGVLEKALEQSLFASRWLLAPVYAGLALALIALAVTFFVEMVHVFQRVFTFNYPEADLVLSLLALVDMVLVGSLIIMVMFSGYENFVSKLDVEGSEQLEWLGKLDANSLKLKVASSIVAISSIHLLKAFMGIGTTEKVTEKVTKVNPQGVTTITETLKEGVKQFTEQDSDRLLWYVIIHLTFVISALLMGVLDKIAFAEHRNHGHSNGYDKPLGGGQP